MQATQTMAESEKKNHRGQDTSGSAKSAISPDEQLAGALLASEIEDVEALEKAALKPHLKLIDQLTLLYSGVGALLVAFQPVAGSIIIAKAPDRAREVVMACRNNKRALAFLTRLVSSTDVATALSGHGLMLYVILIATGAVPMTPQSALMMSNTGYTEVVDMLVWQKSAQEQASAGQPV